MTKIRLLQLVRIVFCVPFVWLFGTVLSFLFAGGGLLFPVAIMTLYFFEKWWLFVPCAIGIIVTSVLTKKHRAE